MFQAHRSAGAGGTLSRSPVSKGGTGRCEGRMSGLAAPARAEPRILEVALWALALRSHLFILLIGVKAIKESMHSRTDKRLTGHRPSASIASLTAAAACCLLRRPCGSRRGKNSSEREGPASSTRGLLHRALRLRRRARLPCLLCRRPCPSRPCRRSGRASSRRTS